MDSFTMPLAARRYIKQHGMPKNPEDLINHIGLIKSGAGFPVTSRLVRANESRTVMWKKSLRYVDMLNIKDALVKGLGISLAFPLGRVLDEIKRGDVAKVLEDWHRPNWHCSVVTRAEDDDPTPIGKFATWYAQRATTEIDQKRNEGFRILSIESTKI